MLYDALRKVDRLLDRLERAGPVMLLLHSQELKSGYSEIQDTISSVFNTLGLLVSNKNGTRRGSKQRVYQEHFVVEASTC